MQKKKLVRAQKVMQEMHDRICGAHVNGLMMAKNRLTQGYSTMETDCCRYVQRCHKCQMKGNPVVVVQPEQ